MTAEAFAPAKINLTLHVTGRRADGYHLLDSLVVFADIGDTVRAGPADPLRLQLTGPEAAGLAGNGDNLVLRAARLLAPGRGAAITLTKRLPLASGIGGGSADAAAALRALGRLWDLPLPSPADCLRLGADVPVCLASAPRRMSGIGDRLDPVPPLPEMEIVLVNPRVPVATSAVFGALQHRHNPPMPANLPRWPGLPAFCAWLGGQRNDLQPPALALHPVIGEVLDALRAEGCPHVAMSGSGATCFGLCPPDGSAARAASAIAAGHPGWWCANGRLL